ncbi:MAG: B12-binding domain-containing radical SAM protein [Candidatus Pacebacteria bacterium]|nr:B12-binding domain-containing radical SAM protein [Candidatus Paceibacterota bacterium]
MNKVLFIQCSAELPISPSDTLRGGYAILEPAACWVAAAASKGDSLTMIREWEPLTINGDFMSDEEILETIKTFDPQAIGFSVFTAGYQRALLLAAQIKTSWPQIRIIFGGWHPSLCPNEVASKDFIDVVVVGPGEPVIKKVLSDHMPVSKKIIRVKPDAEFFGEPNRTGIPIDSLRLTQIGATATQRVASISITRGCPHRCTFCCTPQIYPKLAKRDITEVACEIKYLANNYNTLFIRDECLMADQKYLVTLCQKIRDFGVSGLAIHSFGHVSHASEGIINLMANVGWKSIHYGIESFNFKRLKAIGKDKTFWQNENAFYYTREAGIFIIASVMLCQPGDTLETFDQILRGFKDFVPDEAMVLFLQPFPGTPEHTKCKNQIISTRTENDYFLVRPFVDIGIPEQELHRQREKLLFEYYTSENYKALLKSRKQQMGLTQFKKFTAVFRERQLKRGIDIWVE